jgi:hypothetical protein
MDWLILPIERQAELDAINAQFKDRVCTSVATSDGVLLTNSDKLQDEYWSAYHSFLSSLDPFEGDPVWPVQQPKIITENEPS